MATGEVKDYLDPVRTDFLDFPTAWEIQKRALDRGPELDHHPRCSSVPGWAPISGPALLCDCGAVAAEWGRLVREQTSDPSLDEAYLSDIVSVMARFPLTAAALEHEAEALVIGLLEQPAFQKAIRSFAMASIKDLKDALDSAKGSVDSLTAKIGQVNEASASGIQAADLDPVLAEINTLRSTVEALSSSLAPAPTAAS